MVVYNAASREVTAKIVYCGPGLSGKTTNLQFLHRRLEPSAVGQLLTLAATADRTIFFDLLPVELGDLKGYRIRFQVATVPGQSPYNETRRVVLRGVDGVVFVVDSRWSMLPKNLESFQNLKENLEADGIKLDDIPLIIQYNKRDLADVLAIEALQEGLGLARYPVVEAVATQGKGVVETFKLISKLTFIDILKRLQKRQDIRTVRDDADVSRLSNWKNTLLHSTGVAEAPTPDSEPAEDANMTMAIPLPIKLPLAAGSESPEMTAPSRANRAAGSDALALENPFGAETADSTPAGEDTNPAFFPTPPGAPAPEPAGADDASVATGSFRVASHAGPSPPAEITAPQLTAEVPKFSPEPEIQRRDSRTSSLDSEVRERLERQDERIAGFDDIALRLAHLEETASSESRMNEFRQRIDGIEKRMAKESDLTSTAVNDIRRDHGASRLALENALRDLASTIGVIRRDLAEISSREMEMVAQVSRESLSLQAGTEKIGFRMSEVESKFSDLAVAHTSRIGRVEQLLDELSQRSVADREEFRRSLSGVREDLAKIFSDLAEKLRGEPGRA